MIGHAMPADLHEWLRTFRLDGFLHEHVAVVLSALPDAVRHDIVGDPAFAMSDYEPRAGLVRHVPVGMPRSGRPARSIELKRTLRHRPTEFVRYVIAHELAHAHLRNGGRWPGDDPEHALAAAWGYPRPTSRA